MQTETNGPAAVEENQPLPGQQEAADQATDKIVIIGSGISGLILFFLLKKQAKNVQLFTKQETFSLQKSPVVILWKSALKILLKLGFGKRLSTIAYPLVSLKSSETETEEVLVDFFPTKSTDTDEYAYLPAGVSVRQVDLIRMILTSLTPSAHLVLDPDSPLTLKQPIPGTDISASLAYDSWFINESYGTLIPDFYLNHSLESYQISSTTGTVYLSFSNGYQTSTDMLVGADGAESMVRQLMNDRSVLTFTKQVLITGLSPLTEPFVQVSEGMARSWVGGECAVGVVNMGDKVSWRLLHSQARPGLLAERFVMPKRRKELGFNLGSIQNIHKPGLAGHEKMVSGGSAGEWQIPGSETSTPRESEVAPPALQVIPEIPSVAFDAQILSENLSGEESRDLALSLLPPLPSFITTIIKSTDPLQTYCMDNMDLFGDHPLTSFSTPNFFPGRVILLGDASHTLAVSVVGNHGITLALHDVVTLSDLISTHGISPKVSEGLSSRVEIGNKCISDAHYEATWVKKDGIWKKIVGTVLGNSWCRSKTFDEMQVRGASE